MRTRLIQISWAILTLAALWTFGYWIYWLYAYFQAVPPTQLRALMDAGISVPLYLAICILFSCLIFFSYFVIAQLIMLRRARENFSVLAAVVLLCFGTGNIVPPLPDAFTAYNHIPLLFGIPTFVLNFLGWTLIAAFALTYPDGKFIPRWTPWIALFAFLVSTLWTTDPDLILNLQGIPALLFILVVFFGYGSILYAQVWRYRNHYSPTQKQQVKWFVVGVLGIVVVVVPAILLSPTIVDPNVSPHDLLQTELIYLVAEIGFILLPISVGIAILRYRLWDIDIIIRKTLTYAIVVALLAFVYFGIVILLQRLFVAVTSLRSDFITVISTLAIAALFIPLRNRIQDFIDRRFYRKKYDAQQVLQDFANTVRDETDLEKLTGELVQVINETMQPKSVSVWLKEERR